MKTEEKKWKEITNNECRKDSKEKYLKENRGNKKGFESKKWKN